MSESIENVVLMETAKLIPCRLNPRKNFDGIQSLVASIKKDKIIEPLIVRLLPEGAEVIRGERRRRAAMLAGLPKVPVIIRDYNDQQVIEMCLIEELESKDLSDYEKGLACIELKTKYKQAYPTNKAVAQRLNVSEDTVQRWIQTATDISRDLMQLVATTKIKRGASPPKGTITYDTALTIHRKIREPERQLALAKAIADRSLPQNKARQVVKEVAAFPGRPISEIVEKCLQTAPRVHFSVEDANLIKMGDMTQTTRIERDDNIQEGTNIAATTQFAYLKISTVERKRLADFTEKDAKAEGGYTLEDFKKRWMERYYVWNPNQRVWITKFKVDRPVDLGVE
jgi:ParB/RepB/Spo0J family partition protein